MTVALERFVGAGVEAALADLAALRVAVFRDFPYLYEGTPEYETGYLRPLVASPRSLAVLVRHGARAVGATTALPLADETEDLRRPFEAAGLDVNAVLYLGESVLLPAYRGRGLGVRFFHEREAHARTLGFRVAAFCAVERPDDHPRRPRGYTPNDEFWRRRGYEKRPDLTTTLSWRDLDDPAETPKPMTFWLKELP